jgi:hypothetical protein
MDETEESGPDRKSAAVRLLLIVTVIDWIAIIGIYCIPVFILRMDAFIMVIPLVCILVLSGTFYLLGIMRLQRT